MAAGSGSAVAIAAVAAALLLGSGSVLAEINGWPLDSRVAPEPNPHFVVVCSDHVRLTFLTPRVVRVEWTPVQSRFEDRASLLFINRSVGSPLACPRALAGRTA
jgi:hypothetical protein